MCGRIIMPPGAKMAAAPGEQTNKKEMCVCVPRGRTLELSKFWTTGGVVERMVETGFVKVAPPMVPLVTILWAASPKKNRPWT